LQLQLRSLQVLLQLLIVQYKLKDIIAITVFPNTNYSTSTTRTRTRT